jgi:hypothetical protein
VLQRNKQIMAVDHHVATHLSEEGINSSSIAPAHQFAMPEHTSVGSSSANQHGVHTHCPACQESKHTPCQAHWNRHELTKGGWVKLGQHQWRNCRKRSNCEQRVLLAAALGGWRACCQQVV